jgi:hypothetical protein
MSSAEMFEEAKRVREEANHSFRCSGLSLVLYEPPSGPLLFLPHLILRPSHFSDEFVVCCRPIDLCPHGNSVLCCCAPIHLWPHGTHRGQLCCVLLCIDVSLIRCGLASRAGKWAEANFVYDDVFQCIKLMFHEYLQTVSGVPSQPPGLSDL